MGIKLLMEHVTCGRCGGTGRFGPMCVHSGLCFNCNGKGNVLTKRGRVAQHFLNDLRLRRYDEFKVGDLFLSEGFNAGSYVQPTYWCRVSKIEVDGNSYRIHGENPKHYGAIMNGSADTTMRAGFTGPEKVEQQALALEFQKLLTKSGTINRAMIDIVL